MFKALILFLFLCSLWFGFGLIVGTINAIDRAMDKKDVAMGEFLFLTTGRLVLFSYSIILFVLSIIYLAPLLLIQ